HDGGQFCYAWEEDAELRLSLEPPPAPATECYGVRWTPLRPDVVLKDCFSMANVSWYGGASVRAQRWPLNGAESPAQPFVSGDFSKNPAGYGPVLERYFLGSTGVTVTVAPDVPLFLSLESDRHFCLESPAGSAEKILPIPFFCSNFNDVPLCPQLGDFGGGVERGFAPFCVAVKQCKLRQGRVRAAPASRSPAPRHRRDALRLQHKLSSSAAAWRWPRAIREEGSLSSLISLSRSEHFNYFFSMPQSIKMLKRLNARCNKNASLRLRPWKLRLAASSAGGRGQEGESPLQDVPPVARRQASESFGSCEPSTNTGFVLVSPRSSHLPLFVQMSPLRSDWSHAGLKGVIPSVLHYSLLGYNFFIPDAVGGSLASDAPGDPELYVRWLQIVTFLPVMAFSTPPWLCCDAWVLNLTRQCIRRHRDFVAPLIIKYGEEWLRSGYPIFRPAWWLSPTDPTAFTIEDEFLIGDEVLVAPVTEKGQTWRDIYLPGEGHLWMDTNTARVFDGGTVLRNYSAGLAEVPVFVK
ncbi:SITS-binding protein, partial [Charadrius vociferus]